MHCFLRLALVLSLVAAACSFQPTHPPRLVSSRPTSGKHLVASTPATMAMPPSDLNRRSALEGFDKQVDLNRVAIPTFRWPIVLFFVANPLVLLPFAVLAALTLHLPWLGLAFSTSAAATRTGLLFAVPMLALSLVADRVIPALAQVTKASKTISLYAMGGRLLPLRAVVASVLISSSAAVSEELAFRGCLQTGLLQLLTWASAPAHLATSLSVIVQAIIFGVLHSYTATPAYFATASVAGLAFGAAFSSTANIWVPIVMHFVLDIVSFLICHVQVARSGEEAQRDLLLDSSPIAKTLRRTLLRQREEAEPAQRDMETQ
jgi:membrane protease YdiL (CAAX protease family)